MNRKSQNKTAPEGRTNVSPYLMVENVEEQMTFLINVFNATVTDNTKDKNGLTFHGEVLLGDTTIMMGKASPEWPKTQSMNFVYVENADDTYQLALKNGATGIMTPDDKPYAVREGGFSDQSGNQWWVAHVIEKE
jgi:uncharacterized glyoxalase superfamily protein PhnB